MAEKDGDIAYLGADWTEGIDPWEFGISYDLAEQHSLLRGTVFADRGVYRLGEEVHFKAILRHDTAAGIQVPDAGTPVYVSVRDSQDREIDQRDGEAVRVGLGRVDADAARLKARSGTIRY